MSTRLHIVVPDGLVERIDAVRGDVPRAAWIRRAVEQKLDLLLEPRWLVGSREDVEQALGECGEASVRGGHSANLMPPEPVTPAPAERPGTVEKAISRAAYIPRDSSQSKRDVQPIPKGRP